MLMDYPLQVYKGGAPKMILCSEALYYGRTSEVKIVYFIKIIFRIDVNCSLIMRMKYIPLAAA